MQKVYENKSKDQIGQKKLVKPVKSIRKKKRKVKLFILQNKIGCTSPKRNFFILFLEFYLLSFYTWNKMVIP